MAKSLNRAQILGNLGKDPEMRTTPTGRQVCSFSMATKDSYKDKNDVWQESTEWHNIVLWDRLAETASKYLHKGSKALIEGRIKTRSYEDKNGVTKYITEIVGTSLILLSSAGENQGYNRESIDPPAPAERQDAEEDEVPF